MIRANARLLPFLLPLCATACATAGTYPSLEQRDVERVTGSATPVAGEPAPPAPALPPPSADLVTRLDGLVAVARDADRQFQSYRPTAERAVAAAGGLGSDSWSSASVAVGRLESSRSQAMVAMADLDTLYADETNANPAGATPSGDAIATARDQVAALVQAQGAVIEALSKRLRN